MSERWKWAPVSKIKKAAEELKSTIRARYPDARFSLSRAADDRHIWHLWTAVDIEDPEEVNDLIRDRELDMQIDEHIPLYVIPTRGTAGVTAHMPAPSRRTG